MQNGEEPSKNATFGFMLCDALDMCVFVQEYAARKSIKRPELLLFSPMPLLQISCIGSHIMLPRAVSRKPGPDVLTYLGADACV